MLKRFINNSKSWKKYIHPKPYENKKVSFVVLERGEREERERARERKTKAAYRIF